MQRVARSFVPFQCVALGISAARYCCVTSRGKPFSDQRSPGSALRLKVQSGINVMLLVLRCYGFTKSWIRLDGLSQPMLRRESSGPASGSSLCELASNEG